MTSKKRLFGSMTSKINKDSYLLTFWPKLPHGDWQFWVTYKCFMHYLMFIGKSFDGWCCAYYLPPSPPLMEGWIQEVYFTLPNLVWKLLRSWDKIGAALFQSGGCHQIHAVALLPLQKTYWITSQGIFEITMHYRLIQQGWVSYTTSFLQMIVWCFGSKAQTFWFRRLSPMHV